MAHTYSNRISKVFNPIEILQKHIIVLLANWHVSELRGNETREFKLNPNLSFLIFTSAKLLLAVWVTFELPAFPKFIELGAEWLS